MLPPPLSAEESSTNRRPWLKVALVLSTVVWALAVFGVLITLNTYPNRGEDSVQQFFALIGFGIVDGLFLLGQGIALVVALIARRRDPDEEPDLNRKAVRAPAVSLAVGVVGAILVVMGWRAWFYPLG